MSNEHPRSLPYHQNLFEKLNTSMVRKFAMKTHGSHGPSRLDANKWRKILNPVSCPQVIYAKRLLI